MSKYQLNRMAEWDLADWFTIFWCVLGAIIGVAGTYVAVRLLVWVANHGIAVGP